VRREQLLRDLAKLKARVAKGQLKQVGKIHEAIGRLKERYPSGARYYEIEHNVAGNGVTWTLHRDKKAIAEKLDGS